MESNSHLQIFMMSDGTGETVDKMVRAALIQFESQDVKVSRYKNIRSTEQVDAVLEEAKKRNAVIVYTVANSEVSQAIAKGIKTLDLKAIDLLGPMVEIFSKFFKLAPSNKSGLLHEINEQYFKRIEAMEFTVKHDDGAHSDHLQQADIVLVGVSRTSKTPLSIYLSHKGWKVANVPLIRGIDPPKILQELDQHKIIALTIEPDALAKIRRERLARMGRDPTGDYASIQNIREEIEWARQFFSRNRRWPLFDVTNKALEETATEIEKTILAKNRTASAH